MLVRGREEGQASVVGTIMAIMIMLAVLSLITTQYVPITMFEYEAQHMNDVVTEFSNMRQNIDNLMLTQQRGLSMHSSISLGTAHVPVFSSPTTSRITFMPGENLYELQFSTEDFGLVTETASGMINLYSGNRFYPQQTVYYENSAVIMNQVRTQIVRAGPHFDVVRLPDGNISMTVTLQDIIGSANSETGVHTVGIQTVLRSTETWEYTGINSDVTYIINTTNTKAWFSIFNATLGNNVGGAAVYSEGIDFRQVLAPDYTIIEYPPESFYEGTGSVVLEVRNVSSVLVSTATVSMVLGSSSFA